MSVSERESRVERLLNTLEREIDKAWLARDWEREKRLRTVQDGACAMLAAVHLDEERQARAMLID